MMRGILIWIGEADAANVTGRTASIVKETETVQKGYFTELLCVRAGKCDRADAEKAENLADALQAFCGPGCAVIPELWELPEHFSVQAQCDALLRYLEEAGEGVLVFYGNLPGRLLGTLAAARRKKACIVNVERVEGRQETDGCVFCAERKVCSGHLGCQVGFVPEETVIVLAPEGEERPPSGAGAVAEEQPRPPSGAGAVAKEHPQPRCGEGAEPLQLSGAGQESAERKEPRCVEGAEPLPCGEWQESADRHEQPSGAGDSPASHAKSAGAVRRLSGMETNAVRIREWKLRGDEDLDGAIRTIERIRKESGAKLQSAQVVFVGGRGLRSAENFRRLCVLAEKMGAACGCTRPAAMAGWTDFSRVVGISGSSLRAKVCVTFGVSGSAAFLCGTEQVGRLVAVNNDKNAPIFLSADTGILGDCMSIMEALEKGEEEGWHI